MDDYIKRDDAIRWNPESKNKRDYGTFNLDDAYETGYEDKIKQIEKIPAADVRENVRGRWEVNTILSPPFGFCSVCGAEFGGLIDYNYCPNCGADMRGKKNDRVAKKRAVSN